jgi:hypothetical protein
MIFIKINGYFRLPFEAEHKALGGFDDDLVKKEFKQKVNFNLKNLSENPVN